MSNKDRYDLGGVKITGGITYDKIINGMYEETGIGGQASASISADMINFNVEGSFFLDEDKDNYIKASVLYNIKLLLLLKLNIGGIAYALGQDLYPMYTAGISIIGFNIQYYSKIDNSVFPFNQLARIEASRELLGFKIRGSYFLSENSSERSLLLSLSYKLSILVVNVIPTIIYTDNPESDDDWIFAAAITL